MNWIIENWHFLLAAVDAVLIAAIAICMLIPGDQPEKALQKIVDFIGSFSKK